MNRQRKIVALVIILMGTASALRAAEPFRFSEAKHGKGELKYLHGYPVLLLEGTPEEIGEQTAVLAKTAAAGVSDYLKKLLKNYAVDAAWPQLVKAAGGMLARFPPDHRKEMQAACKVFGVDKELHDAILVGNCLWDIKKLGCSTLVVQPERSAIGQPIFGRNFDFPGLDTLHEYSLLVICRPQGKHAFASVTFPGLLGCMSGMNDAGLAIATLDVETTGDGSPKFDVTGTPMLLTFRRILEECTTVAEAEKLLREAKRTTSMNLTVCDKSGGVIFELTPKNVAVRRPAEGLCCCTNHFRSKELATITECDRYLTLHNTRDVPKVGIEEVARRLHMVNQGQWTIQTMIFEPATLKLRLAMGKGPASDKELKVFELEPLFKHGPVAAAHLERGFRYPEAAHGKARLRYINDLPVLALEGEPAEMGEQFGTLVQLPLQELAIKGEFCYRLPLLTRRIDGPLGVSDVGKKMHEVNQGPWTIHSMVFEPATLTLHLNMGKGPASAGPLKKIELGSMLKLRVDGGDGAKAGGVGLGS